MSKRASTYRTPRPPVRGKTLPPTYKSPRKMHRHPLPSVTDVQKSPKSAQGGRDARDDRIRVRRASAHKGPTGVSEAYAGTKARVRGVSGEGSAVPRMAGPMSRQVAEERARSSREGDAGRRKDSERAWGAPDGPAARPSGLRPTPSRAQGVRWRATGPRSGSLFRRLSKRRNQEVPEAPAAPNGRQVAEDGARAPASRPRSAAAAAKDCDQRDPSTPLAPRARFAQDDKRTSCRRWSEGARIPTQERRHRREGLRPARSFDSARPAGSLRSG